MVVLPLKQYFATLAADHDVEALLEVVEMEAVSNHWTQVQTTQQHLLHLVPCLPHAAAGDTLDSQSIEDDIRPIDLRVAWQDTQLRDISTLIHVRNHIIKRCWCTRHL